MLLLQLFVCRGDEDNYYQNRFLGCALRLPRVPVLPNIVPERQTSPVDDITSSDQHRQVALQLEEAAFLPRNIAAWMCAKDETLHREINWNSVNDDEDSEFHEKHEPLDGFKLLGYVGQSLESQENFIAPKMTAPWTMTGAS